MKTIINVTLFLCLFISFAHANSSEQSKLCSVTSKDVKDSAWLKGAVIDYIDDLKDINSLSFKDKNIQANVAVSLIEEKEILIAAFNDILSSLKKLEGKNTRCSIKEWTFIAQKISNSLRYMDDLESYKLIKECKACYFDMEGSYIAFGNINNKLKTITNVQ